MSESIPAAQNELQTVPAAFAPRIENSRHLPARSHGFLTVLTGGFALALGPLAWSLAAGTRASGMFSVAAALFLMGGLWFVCGWWLLRPARPLLALLLGSGLWTLVLSVFHAKACGAVLNYASAIQRPVASFALTVALLLVAGCAACAVRLLKEPSAAGGSLQKALALAAGVALILASVWAAPFLGERRYRQEARALEDEHVLLPEPKLVVGAVSTTRVCFPQGEDAGSRGWRAELQSMRDAGCTHVRIEITGTAERDARSPLIEAARAMGLRLVLADVPWTSPPGGALTTKDFAQRHETRVLRMAKRYRPAVYSIAQGPWSYYRGGEIAGRFHPTQDPPRWAAHLTKLARKVKAVSPGTRIAVTIRPWIPEERGMLARKLHGKVAGNWRPLLMESPEIDIIGLEAYDQAGIGEAERLFQAAGHPVSYDKAWWLMGAYNGWPLAPGRDEDTDRLWLRGVSNWAQFQRAGGVLARSFGTFVPGGHGQAVRDGSLADLASGAPKLSPIGQVWSDLAVIAGQAVSPAPFEGQDIKADTAP